MNYRQRLIDNIERGAEIDNEMQVLAEQSGGLRRENQVLARQIISSEKLLSGPTWKVGLNTKNPENIFLFGVFEDDLPEIMDLPSDGFHHYSIDLVVGEEEIRFPGTHHERGIRPTLVHISFNDGDASIHFDDPGYAAQFLKDFEIKISTDDIRDRAKGLETAAAAIYNIADHAEGQ